MIKPPFNLRCEYLKNPIEIDTHSPPFSWLLSHKERKQFQFAYQIIVSSEKSFSQSEKGDLWDSGKVESDDSFHIIYEGKPLRSDTKYYWRIKWWDFNGNESSYSNIATFGTALLNNTDWQAKWISRKEFIDKKAKKSYQYKTETGGMSGRIKEFYAVYLRKEFTIDKPIEKAKIYVCGLGFYELRINSNKIGERILEPAQTDYNKIALYSTYDITNSLKTENAIGVILGNGRCIENYGYNFPKLILQINIHYKDGNSNIICSDESWNVSQGPIRENGIYYGETYDARLDIHGWDEPNFDDSSWDDVISVKGYNLASQMMQPIKISKILKPQKIYSSNPGIYIYDFGQNFTGFIRLKVRGPRGCQVILRFSELVYDDGTLNTATNGNAKATDMYFLKGEGEEIFEPHFTYHGFRYVEITGFPGVPTIDNVEGLFFHTAVKKVGDFSCSNDLFNQIHTNIIWGQLSNLMSIPTDCPQRDERNGWMGDAQLTVEEAIFNFDMARFYSKYVRDILLCQKEDGSLSDVVPPYWKFYPADPVWGTAYITIAWYIYWYYGDIRILKEHYEGMKKYVKYLSSIAKENLIYFGKWGDWCPPCNIVPRKTPVELTSSWYYYHDVHLLSKIAQILGHQEDQECFSNKANAIKEAFNAKFLKGVYDIKKLSPVDRTISQTSNILPLYLDMVPENKKNQVLSTLVKSIKEEFSYHFDTGIVGTRYIFDVLTENG
jgi:alpha-L-rhamnosidase